MTDQEHITERQRHLPEIDWREWVTPTRWKSYMRHMCWWRLEAMRGAPSSAKSLEYARNMRWAAEHAREKPGTWLEIVARVGARAEVA